MKPVIDIGGAQVFHGDCREVLKHLPDNSVDSVVTDPPYELGFMGKSWDSTGIAYDVSVWEECLRVLKPGGHILAFGGSRTFHRLAVAVEDAGFEIRDSIAWIYGSGFPKSLDVSKAIDKRGGQGALLTKEIGEALRVARESRGISKSKADEIFCDGTTNWTWFEGRPAGQRPPTPDTFARIVAEWPELAVFAGKVAEAEREVIGQKAWSNSANHFVPGENHKARVNLDETAPNTSEAKQWQGWGTALKPAHEPVVVGRKPFAKGSTVAGNVLEWGVGGLNIDGSRIGTEENLNGGAYAKSGTPRDDGWGMERAGAGEFSQPAGRWPANVILDEVTAGLLDEQSGVSKDGVAVKENSAGNNIFSEIAKPIAPNQGYGGQGGASRFFYVAKASKRDRNEGMEIANTHPTVKPTQLMRYLIKLVTPPGGTVLDPFTGSGSTGKAALLDGFNFVGAELTEEYLPIIEGRLRWAVDQGEETEERLF